MSSFGEILNDFKANEEADNIIAIIDNSELQNGMIAWKSVQIKYKSASDCQEKDSVAQWNWMWRQIEYDANNFGVVAGVKAQDIGNLLSRLIGLRLIYPDGTVNNLASQFLQGIIFSKIGKVVRNTTPQKPAKQSSVPQVK